MLRFRLTLISLIGWLFLLYNIERIHEPFNIASFVYVLCALGTILLIFTGGGRRESVTLTTYCVCLVLLVVLKIRWGYPVLGIGLTITITEAVAFAVTFTLASRIANGIRCFEEGSFELTMAQDYEDFELEQTQMYNEVRRARQFERPLALAFVSGDTANLEHALHPLIVQSQRAAAKRYARAKIAESIGSELGECDMIACHQDGYVVVLPEADRSRATEVLQKLQEKIGSQFNVQLQSGVAMFPTEEVTFAGLLARAAAEVSGNANPIAPALDVRAEPSNVENESDKGHVGHARSASDFPEPASHLVSSRTETVASDAVDASCDDAQLRQHYFASALGLSLNIQGSKDHAIDYLNLLTCAFGDHWTLQVNGSAASMQIDVDLETAIVGPPASAVEMNGDWFTDQAFYRPTEKGWFRLEWCGANRWTLARPAAARSFPIEQAMFRLALLRANGLPLHASVGRCEETGVAAIGGPESGKTAVLLALLELGGQWVCDDEGFCVQDLATVYGTSPTMQIKQRYLGQLPHLSHQVRAKDRLGLQLSRVARSMAGGMSKVRKLPRNVRRRLRRIADGQTSTSLSPPGRLPFVNVNSIVLVTRGRNTQLTAVDKETWADRGAQILWPEIRQLHEWSRRMQAATGGRLIDSEADDELRLQHRIREFAASKSTFCLTRTQDTPLDELAMLLKRVLDPPVGTNGRRNGSPLPVTLLNAEPKNNLTST